MSNETQTAKLPADVQAILDKSGNKFTKLTGGVRLPSVRLIDKVDLFFRGTYKGRLADRKVKGKDKQMHSFALIETSAPVDQWDSDEKKREVIAPTPGILVEIMGGTILDAAFAGNEGKDLLIVYKGEVKGKQNTYKAFDVYRLS